MLTLVSLLLVPITAFVLDPSIHVHTLSPNNRLVASNRPQFLVIPSSLSSSQTLEYEANLESILDQTVALYSMPSILRSSDSEGQQYINELRKREIVNLVEQVTETMELIKLEEETLDTPSIPDDQSITLSNPSDIVDVSRQLDALVMDAVNNDKFEENMKLLEELAMAQYSLVSTTGSSAATADANEAGTSVSYPPKFNAALSIAALQTRLEQLQTLLLVPPQTIVNSGSMQSPSHPREQPLSSPIESVTKEQTVATISFQVEESKGANEPLVEVIEHAASKATQVETVVAAAKPDTKKTTKPSVGKDAENVVVAAKSDTKEVTKPSVLPTTETVKKENLEPISTVQLKESTKEDKPLVKEKVDDQKEKKNVTEVAKPDKTKMEDVPAKKWWEKF